MASVNLSKIMDYRGKKEIGANLKFILGKPDQINSVTDVEGVLLRRDAKSGFQGSEPFPNGVFGEFGDAPNSQFVHDLLPMGFHGLHTDG